MDIVRENVIEWINGQRVATVTFAQKKYINRIKRLVRIRTPGVEIVHENNDGSIVAHVPIGMIIIADFSRNSYRKNADENQEYEE